MSNRIFETYIFLLIALFVGSSHAALIGMSTDTDSFYEINPYTGEATFISKASGNYGGIGLSFLNRDLYATDRLEHIGDPWDVRFTQVEIQSGNIIDINQQGGSLNWHGLASDETRQVFYTIDINDNFILKVVSPNGQINSIGNGTGIDGRGMAYDDQNEILYATDTSGGLFSVNASTGASTLIGDLGLGDNTLGFLGLAYDEVLEVLYANVVAVDFAESTREASLYTVNVLTGEATLVGQNGVNFIDGLAWISDESAVPEPNSIALFMLGILGFGYARRKRVN